MIDLCQQKEECPLVVADLSPKLKALTNLCDSLTQDKRLAEFLALLLQLGNYLNAVRHLSTIVYR